MLVAGRSRFGFKLDVVGANEYAARYAGIDPRWIAGIVLALSGALAGLAGAVEIAGLYGRLQEGFATGFGITAIAVALVARLNPLFVPLSALLFSLLYVGLGALARNGVVPFPLINIIEGTIILLFLAGSVAFGSRKPVAWSQPMDEILLVSGLLAAGIRLATPIALAAIGETLSQRAGVINVGIEGIMLVGAFVAVLFTVLAGNPWVGLVAALIAGALLGALHAFFTARLKVEQIVSGIALLFLGLGLSGYGFRLTLAQDGEAVQVPGFTELDLFGLGDLPLIGSILFGQYALVYLAVLSALALAWILCSHTARHHHQGRRRLSNGA